MKFSAAVAQILTAGMQILTAGMLMVFAGPIAAQQGYPTKPIRLITPYAPGGSTSVAARIIGQKLTESWGQPVLVDSRPGGNTIIGTEALVKSTPDGHTIILITSSHAINPNLFPTPYDAIKDFAPVATTTSSGYMLVLHPSVPANNLQEFIAYAKSRPGELNYASVGTGGSTHLATELFNVMAGVRTQHVPYKGGGAAINDILGCQVQMWVTGPINVATHVKSGRLKAIAVTGEARSSALPQVPTFTEAGLPGVDVKNWQGILAPAGTPRTVIDKLSTEIARILAMPDISDKLLSQGADPFISTPDQFAAMIRTDIGRYAKIIKIANIKMEN